MENTKIKKLFYNFKDREFIVKDLNFDIHNKEAWICIGERLSRKGDCFFLEEMELKHCGKFASYVTEKERIGPRDPELPELTTVLEYFIEWKEDNKKKDQTF